MTDLQPEEFSEPVEMNYLPINDLHVLGGTANGSPHVFLSVSILNAEGEVIKVTYGMSPWEAIRLGVVLGDTAISTVDRRWKRPTRNRPKSRCPSDASRPTCDCDSAMSITPIADDSLGA